MSDIRAAMLADRRLAILRLLVEAGGEVGESSLEKTLKAWGFGTLLDRKVVQEDLRFLESVHCIEIEYAQERYMVAAITQRGIRCQAGTVMIDGVSEPTLKGR